MRNPIISIITPTWNAAATIEKAILSTVNQRYKNIEHIFIDNSSIDKTVSIISDYQKKFIHIRFITEKDNGVYDAMNKGLKLCNGDWIYFLGADDEFYNEHVLEELFELGLFQQEQVLYGNVLVKGDASWAKDGTIFDGPFDLEKLFRKNICHQSIFYPRSVIKQIGYYSDKYSATADWDYNVRCFTQYKFTFADKIIAIFKGGGKSSKGGVLCFNDELPENVINYFQLDPQNKSLHDISSPFYYPIARYRIKKYLRVIEDQKVDHEETVLKIHTENDNFIQSLKTEHLNTIKKLMAENDNFIQTMKSEHLNAIKKLMAENDESQMVLKTTHEQSINLIQTEISRLKELLSQKENELNRQIESGKQQFDHLSHIISIKEEEVASLKAMILEKEQRINTILQSYTWKTGRNLLFPAQFILNKIRKV